MGPDERSNLRLAYDVVDVFAERPFAGNQLAVVHGAQGLSSEQCLALTREFGYAETTFPSSEVVGGREYATRIFTPEREIPFAGHPTLGTAWVLRSAGRLTSEECVQVCGAGRIGVRFDGDLVELSATPRDLAGPADAGLSSEVLRLVGLSTSDLAGPVWVAGCGLTFVHVPVTDEAVARARPAGPGFGSLVDRLAALGRVEEPPDALNLYAVSGDAPPPTVHARVFVPGAAVPEDPATGSAAAGLGMVLAASGLLPQGGRYDILQGLEVGRPSTLHGRVEAEDGRATLCHVAGRVQPVASGHIRVPG